MVSKKGVSGICKIDLLDGSSRKNKFDQIEEEKLIQVGIRSRNISTNKNKRDGSASIMVTSRNKMEDIARMFKKRSREEYIMKPFTAEGCD